MNTRVPGRGWPPEVTRPAMVPVGTRANEMASNQARPGPKSTRFTSQLVACFGVRTLIPPGKS